MTVPAADDEAAHWYARLFNEEVSPSVRRDFEAWYAAKDAHRRAWDKLERVAIDADELASSDMARTMVAQALSNPARGDAATVQTHTTAKRSLVLTSLAVATLVLGLVGYQLSPFSGSGANTGKQALVLATNAADKPLDHVLEDGSRVTLDANSQITVASGSGGRTIELSKGQAFFRVAKDPRHPFTVSSAGYRVTALGTKFDVDMRAEMLEVALIEGKVRVDALDNGKHWTLEPGMRLVARNGRVEVHPGGADASRNWIDGFISFDDAPLGEVVAKLNPHLKQPLELGESLKNRHFSGTLKTGDASALTEALKAYGIARVERTPEGNLRLVPY